MTQIILLKKIYNYKQQANNKKNNVFKEIILSNYTIYS